MAGVLLIWGRCVCSGLFFVYILLILPFPGHQKDFLLARRASPCYNAYILHIVDVLLFRLRGTSTISLRGLIP